MLFTLNNIQICINIPVIYIQCIICIMYIIQNDDVVKRIHPICKCGKPLKKYQLKYCYQNDHKNKEYSINSTKKNPTSIIVCDICGDKFTNDNAMIYHCPFEKNNKIHIDGYDLCLKCGNKQIIFDEFNNIDYSNIKRNNMYNIRLTLIHIDIWFNNII